MSTRPLPAGAFPAAVVAVLGAALGAGCASAPASRGSSSDSTAERAVERWRVERLEALNEEEGWLSVVGLHWLQDGVVELGFADRGTGDPSITLTPPAVHAEGDELPPTIGALEVSGLRATLRPVVGSALRIEGERPARVDLETDSGGEPTRMTWGPLVLYVIERGGELALRVKDRSLPATRRIEALPAYPVADEWVLAARFEAFEEPRALGIPNITGREYDQSSPGEIVLTLEGEERRLVALDNGPDALLLVVGDRTNGETTYGGGRYLSVERPRGEDGRLELDLNRLYNPPCVFTAFATCPLPPRQNRLAGRIEAGEQYPDLPWMHVEAKSP